MYDGYDVYQTCPSGTQPYTIRAGDTYFSLAIRFNTTVAAIMAANPGVNPDRLMIGQRICIPGAPMPGEVQWVRSLYYSGRRHFFLWLRGLIQQ